MWLNFNTTDQTERMDSAARPPAHRWPTDGLPQVQRAVRALLDDRNFAVQYGGAITSFHLYDYHGLIRIDGHTYPIRPGVCTITPYGSHSAYDMPAPGRHWCLHLHAAPSSEHDVLVPVWQDLGTAAARFSDRCAHITRCWQAGDSGDRAAQAQAQAASQDLILGLARQAQASTEHTKPRGHWALEAVARHCHQQLHGSLDIPALAAEVGLSQNYLSRLFRAEHGCTIHRYWHRVRIQEACHHLAHSTLAIKAIGAACGWSDPQLFNKEFRRLTGLSPSAWRSAHGSPVLPALLLSQHSPGRSAWQSSSSRSPVTSA